MIEKKKKKLKILRIIYDFPDKYEATINALGPAPYELSLAQEKLGHTIYIL